MNDEQLCTCVCIVSHFATFWVHDLEQSVTLSLGERVTCTNERLRTTRTTMHEYLNEQQVPLREVGLNDFFMLSDPNHCEQVDERKVYIRGEYDRTSKRYSVCKYCDVNDERFMRGDRLVWVGFCF